MTDEDKLKRALMRRALGYKVNEVVDEFLIDEGGAQKLSKRKITKKYFAPDITALKLLIEKFYPDTNLKISEMTDEELLEEREKILQLLKEEANANWKVFTKNKVWFCWVQQSCNLQFKHKRNFEKRTLFLW